MMEDILKNHEPIDYRTWILGDEERKGVNLKRLKLLNSMEIKIIDSASYCNDARNDPGQAEIVAYFALKLLDHNKEAKREVTVPAAILHDTGFYFAEPTAWKKLVSAGGNTETEDVRRPHQNRGIMMATKILCKLNYPEEYLCEIADIIGDHDTRKLPTTVNGDIVRASDYLWRFTLPCVKSYNETEPAEIVFKKSIPHLSAPAPFNLTEPALTIGRIELANTMIYKFGDKCYDLLKQNGYEKEMNKVLKFYDKK